MGKRTCSLLSLLALLSIAGAGCQKSKSPESNPGNSTQPQQDSNQPANGNPSGGSPSENAQPGTPQTGNSQPNNPQPSNPQPGNPSSGYVSPISTGLVKALQFDASGSALLTASEKTALEREFLDCGVSDSLVPACRGSNFLVSMGSISTYGGPDYTEINGKVGRYKDTSKTIYLFRIEKPSTAGTPKSSIVQLYVSSSSSTTSLDNLADQARQKLTALTTEERLAKLEDTLSIKRVAALQEWTFANEGEFASAYSGQNTARAYYHWSIVGLNKGYKGAQVVQYFKAHFSEKLSASTADYKDLFVELGLSVVDSWKVRSEVIEAFRAEYSASSDVPLRGKLAISILGLAPAQEASSEHLIAARDFLLSTSESQWVRRGVSLFTKYGSVFGSSADLVRFGSSSDWSIRKEVAKALANYNDELANQWALRLNADTDNDVRSTAYATISARSFDAGNFDASSLINASNWSSRAGLAKALRHVTGSEADAALLRLNADTDNDVRTTALAALQARPCDVANLNVSGLINTSNWSARSGLAKALKYVGGPGADEALLRLNADTDNDVRTAALDSIKTRPLNAGDLDVSSFINASNWSARAGLARALGFVGGHGADQALLRLNADTDNDVRTAALVSIEARPFDAANFNVSGLINSSNWSARAGLARALKSVTGQGANEALLRLNADTDNDVRTAALASITARPFDAGDFNVSSLINASNWSSRAGLARALRYVTGQKSINALITLVLDSDSDVRNAAQESLKAHGFGG